MIIIVIIIIIYWVYNIYPILLIFNNLEIYASLSVYIYIYIYIDIYTHSTHLLYVENIRCLIDVYTLIISYIYKKEIFYDIFDLVYNKNDIVFYITMYYMFIWLISNLWCIKLSVWYKTCSIWYIYIYYIYDIWLMIYDICVHVCTSM